MRTSRRRTPQQIASHFDQYFQKVQEKQRDRPLQVRVYSQKLGLDYSFPSDSTNQPYHTASIGKVFTAVLVYRLAQQGLVDVQQPLTRYLPGETLKGLFVVEGVDYTGQVTVDHLLGHTSGVADYFEGRTRSGKTFASEILAHPATHWTPQMLLAYTREHQTALSAPGKAFHYSDSGYILLGLLIEAVTGKSFAANLEENIFWPLEMRDSYLMFSGQPRNLPAKTIEKIWFNGCEISAYESLSCDWAGGGIITTTADLLKFQQALRNGGLVSAPVLAQMDDCPHKFQPGIYYGKGMMEIRFKDFFFLLGKLPRVKGHIGILATHMFYDTARDAHVILNFGDTARMVESFRALIEIETQLLRLG